MLASAAATHTLSNQRPCGTSVLGLPSEQCQPHMCMSCDNPSCSVGTLGLIPGWETLWRRKGYLQVFWAGKFHGSTEVARVRHD